MKVSCCSCGKQIVRGQIPSRNDRLITKAEGGKCGFGNELFCGYCAEDLDENGLFPEEMAQAERMDTDA